MRQTAIGFYSKRLSLEGVLAIPEQESGPFAAIVVCHPHPVLGGNMEHPVVTGICRAADSLGIASLRFNFRGVGDSEGEFTNGEGEQRDLKAALDVLRRWPGIDSKRVALAGYSFGASVVLGGLRMYKAGHSLALIAPPVSAVRDSRVRKDRRAKLFLVGQRDRVVPSAELQRVLDDVQPPLRFSEVPDADHGLQGQERVVAERVASFVADSLAP